MRRVDTSLNSKLARLKWSITRSHAAFSNLKIYSETYRFSIAAGDLLFLNQSWYVTHAGLLRLAHRRNCCGIEVQPVTDLWDPGSGRFGFKATVFTSHSSKGFVGFGDADPSNVSPLVRGAEMRVAETRAVNRALRKAYGIGLCSVEELGSTPEPRLASPQSRKPTQPANGDYGAPRLRDQLCQLIRHHHLDPILVKAFANDFCRTKTLREASREQIESFVEHLADRAEKDRTSLLSHLNRYLPAKGSAA